MMSPFGKLLIALTENTIKDLAMEVLENETSLVEYNAVEKLFKDIQDDFEKHQIIKLFNINQIIATLKKRNSVYKTSLSTSHSSRLTTPSKKVLPNWTHSTRGTWGVNGNSRGCDSQKN